MNYGIFVGLLLGFTGIIIGHIIAQPSRWNAPNTTIMASALLTSLAVYSTEIFQSQLILRAIWFYKVPYLINTLNIGLPYLYFRKIISKERSFILGDFWVLIPVIIVGIYMHPFFLLDPDIKRIIYVDSTAISGPKLNQELNPINESVLIFLIGIYTVTILVLLRRLQLKYLEESSRSDDIKQSVFFFNWIRYYWQTHLLFFILIIIYAVSIFISSYFGIKWSQIATGSTILIGWMSIFYYAALNPNLLDLLPEKHEYVIPAMPSNASADFLAINELLKSQPLFLKSGLTLFELALHCELSQVRVRTALKS